MIDLHISLKDPFQVLLAVGIAVLICCTADVIRALVAPDQWQAMGGAVVFRARAWWARRRHARTLVHDHLDTLGRHARLQNDLDAIAIRGRRYLSAEDLERERAELAARRG